MNDQEKMQKAVVSIRLAVIANLIDRLRIIVADIIRSESNENIR